MTQLTVPFVLPDDVLLTPVAQLSSDARALLGAPDADVAITRPRSRTASSVVDRDFAALLERFRSTRTIVDAVVDFSREREADPRTVLAGAFPVLQKLIRAGLLLPAGDDRARAIAASFEIGDRIDDFEITRRISLLHDVELYQARSVAGGLCILKIARDAGGPAIRSALRREAKILSRLDGVCAPRLVAEREHDGTPYLAIEWRSGASPSTAAAEFRENSDRRSLLELCARIAESYAALHDGGIVHGDVHDRNILIDRDGSAAIIDFGLSRTRDAKRGPRRAGVWLYHDPELAAAQLRDATPDPPTEKTDQYGVGALLFMLATGASYVEFSLRRQKALEQILNDAPRAFADCGTRSWPELERVLGRMMAKNPEARFGSMADVAGALREIARPMDLLVDARRDEHEAGASNEPAATPITAPAVMPSTAPFVNAMLERTGLDGPLYRDRLTSTPLCGVNLGASGIALAWYRLALFRGDADALACAIAWGKRAATLMAEPEAFYTADHAISPKSVGTISLSHTESGLHCVRTLIALAGGDFSESERWSAAFERSARVRSTKLDLTLGRAGLLLGCTMIDEALPRPSRAIRDLGDSLARSLGRRLAAAGQIARSSAIPSAGIAHGWAGILYALMRWSAARREPISATVADRVSELAGLARHTGRGLSWPREVASGQSDPIPSWCNGNAGFVFFWLYAAQIVGEQRYLDLAEQTAWNVWDGSTDSVHHLCCGLAGRAYALLALHRHTGSDMWLGRAKRLALRAVRNAEPDSTDSHSLYRGALGVALLAAEIEDPSRARMPFFEAEGWQWHRSPRQ